MIIYLDTSALVKLYAEEEDGRELVQEAVDASEVAATSSIAYAEVRAGLVPKPREGTLVPSALDIGADLTVGTVIRRT